MMQSSRAPRLCCLKGPLPQAAILYEWFVAPVERVNGQLQITLQLPCADDAPHAALFPADIISPPSGRVPLLTDVVAEPAAQESGV